MSYQYTGPQGQSYARSWGDDFNDQEKRNLQIKDKKKLLSDSL